MKAEGAIGVPIVLGMPTGRRLHDSLRVDERAGRDRQLCKRIEAGASVQVTNGAGPRVSQVLGWLRAMSASTSSAVCSSRSCTSMLTRAGLSPYAGCTLSE